MKHDLETTILDNGDIEQRLMCLDGLHGPEVVARWVIGTRESSVRDALVKLGWTPPQGEGNE